jgi:HTH-type transcriptional regulator, cell division transcriptional repressor
MTQSAETQSDAQEGGYYAADVATLGDRIAAAREEAGMTAKQLAKRLGVKTSTLEDWEEDRADPRANRLTTMAGMLGVSVVWLLTGEGAGVTPPGQTAPAPGMAKVLADLSAMKSDAEALAIRIAQVEKALQATMAEERRDE